MSRKLFDYLLIFENVSGIAITSDNWHSMLNKYRIKVPPFFMMLQISGAVAVGEIV